MRLIQTLEANGRGDDEMKESDLSAGSGIVAWHNAPLRLLTLLQFHPSGSERVKSLHLSRSASTDITEREASVTA